MLIEKLWAIIYLSLFFIWNALFVFLYTKLFLHKSLRIVVGIIHEPQTYLNVANIYHIMSTIWTFLLWFNMLPRMYNL